MASFRTRRVRMTIIALVMVFGIYKLGFNAPNSMLPSILSPSSPHHESSQSAFEGGDVPLSPNPPDGTKAGPETEKQDPLDRPVNPYSEGGGRPVEQTPIVFKPSSFNWSEVKEQYPVTGPLTPLPTGHRSLPRVQYDFSSSPSSSAADEADTESRRIAVKSAFLRCWDSYRSSAWLSDELRPIAGGGKVTFGGWSATLVDSLDTLWIMGLEDEFRDAATAAVQMDFAHTAGTSVNLFETTIRHLGGLLSAYDLSGEEALKTKAVELGDMLHHAFDTHNRMPGFWFVFKAAKSGNQKPGSSDPSACPGSLSMEFTRLSQLTGDPKYYDAVARIKSFFQNTQSKTQLPGMWPVQINFNTLSASSDNSFTIGAAADSLYEYLLKTHLVLGGADESWAKMYETAMGTVEKHLLFSPMIPTVSPGSDEEDGVLFSGTTFVRKGSLDLSPEAQHLSCFAGGLYALGGKILANTHHVDIGAKITRGCVWAYNATVTGIMPEIFNLIPCPQDSPSSIVDSIASTLLPGSNNGNTNNLKPCAWNETLWESRHNGRSEAPKGMAHVRDSRYILRPEAIESVFVLYRVTGDPALRDVAWRMFTSIMAATKTDLGNSALRNVMVVDGGKEDSMESFWLAETLKYFYLIFSPPDVISLDDYVFNTEAHPLKRPK